MPFYNIVRYKSNILQVRMPCRKQMESNTSASTPTATNFPFSVLSISIGTSQPISPMIDPGSTARDEDVGDMESPMDATREVSSGWTITSNTYAGYIIKTFQWAEGVEILMSNG